MKAWPLRWYIQEWYKKQIIYVSLLFVALNPMSENDDDSNQAGAYNSFDQQRVVQNTREHTRNGRHNVSYEHTEALPDHETLGKFYLLQGEVARSYQDLFMGDGEIITLTVMHTMMILLSTPLSIVW